MSDSVYMRRNGGLTFWRLGRLGGSFYLAHGVLPRRSQTWRTVPRSDAAPSYGPTIVRVRNAGDLIAVIPEAVRPALYGGACMIAGMALAAVAMWH